MAANGVILLSARSVGGAFSDRWWVPTAEMLEAVRPGSAQVKILAVQRGPAGEADLWEARAVWLDVTARTAEELGGIVVGSDLAVDGYEEGDELTVGLDRVFDVAFLDADGEPLGNVERARFAVGKTVLVGITVLSADGDPIERRSFAGTVEGFEVSHGIELRLTDGTAYRLPPDPRALREAPPGEYRLRAGGNPVVDPDYLATWSVQQGAESRSAPGPRGFEPPG